MDAERFDPAHGAGGGQPSATCVGDREDSGIAPGAVLQVIGHQLVEGSRPHLGPVARGA